MYCDILISNGDINQDLLAVGNNLPHNDVDFDVESDNGLEYPKNPLNAHGHSFNESLVNEKENLLELAPGEDRDTGNVFFLIKIEELAFPKTFLEGKFGYTFPREQHLRPTKCFNQRVINYSQKSVSNNDYMFFAQSV